MKILASRGREIIFDQVSECKTLGTRIVDDLIYQGQFKAWRSGKWKGYEKTMTLKIYDDRFVLPDEWNVLLGVNVGNKNHQINGYWYEFNGFGPGTLKECTWTYHQVVELNDVPTPFPIGKNERLGVRTTRPEDADAYLLVQGKNSFDTEVQTQQLVAENGEIVTDEIHGEKIFFKPGAIVVGKTRYDHDGIEGIFKTPTKGKVYLYAISDEGQSRELGEMGPNQTESFLKNYRLPGPSCRCNHVHALVKKSEPRRIISDTDVLQVENEEALRLLVLSAYYETKVFDTARASYFYNQGIAALNGQKTQDKGGRVTRLKMDGNVNIDRDWNPRSW